MTKKTLIFILTVFIIITVGIFFYQRSKGGELVLEKSSKQNIAQATMEGEVTFINKEANSIIIKASTIEKTKNGNELVYYDKNIIFSDKVNFIDKSVASTTAQISPANLLGKIVVGDRLSFSGLSSDGFFSKTESFKADKVEIILKLPVYRR